MTSEVKLHPMKNLRLYIMLSFIQSFDQILDKKKSDKNKALNIKVTFNDI